MAYQFAFLMHRLFVGQFQLPIPLAPKTILLLLLRSLYFHRRFLKIFKIIFKINEIIIKTDLRHLLQRHHHHHRIHFHYNHLRNSFFLYN